MTSTHEPERRDRRGYSWPPFEAGNTAALVHGARSPSKVEPIAARFRETFTDSAPWAASPAFAGTVASWAHAEAQAVLVRAHLEEVGMFDSDGEERPAVRTLDRIEGRLAKLRDQLGLNPQSLSKLLASAATLAHATGDAGSLAALQAEGQALLEARGQHPAVTEPGDEEGPD